MLDKLLTPDGVFPVGTSSHAKTINKKKSNICLTFVRRTFFCGK